MIGLFGYNFFGDGNSLDPTPTNVENIDKVKLTGTVVEHLNISRATDNDSDEIPTAWDVDDIINAAFNGTLAGGSLEQIGGDITGYKIKRRKMGEFEWTTIAERTISSLDELSFEIVDNLAQNNTEYEYAFVPVTNGQEGQYIIQTVLSKFDGVFIADDTDIFQLDAAVSYGNTTTNQKIGVYEPFGKKYPVVVSNGITSYESGSLSGTVLPENYQPGQKIDRAGIVAKRKLLIDFLNNRKPKIIKDWNGNLWLCMITQNPSTEYLPGSGMGMVNVSSGWSEVGDANNRQDLYDCGLIPNAN